MKSVAFNFRIALAALLCCLALARAASAQEESASAWVKVAPPHEAFTVMMPGTPRAAASRSESGRLKVAGQRYRMSRENADYTVWSFQPASLPAAFSNDSEAYLDQGAEIAWDLIIEARSGWLTSSSGSLTYDAPLSLHRIPGKRYRVNLGKQSGIAHIYADGSQMYIVAAWGAARETASVEEFVKSFNLNSPPGAGVGDAAHSAGVGNGNLKEPGGTGYSRVFAAREVTQKARILKRVEPAYTERARSLGVTGRVRLRVVLWPSGKVSHVASIHRLPHGLTWQAIEAAARLKFTPAMKDGQAVPQYILIDYNFNVY